MNEPRSHRDLVPEDRPARPADVETPEAVVGALYEALSGPAETSRSRDWDRLRSLCLPVARFLIGRWVTADGEVHEVLREWTVESFIEDARRFYAEAGFWEREIRSRTERFGNVAHVFSSYESRVGSESSEPVSRGINSVQLIRHAGRWCIVSVVWDIETDENRIPPDYDAVPA